MTKFETMFWEKSGPIARITLHRPEVLNAMNTRATCDLQAVADQISTDEEIRSRLLHRDRLEGIVCR
jgi:enoyl-CoA hydratase/carnithine racemase